MLFFIKKTMYHPATYSQSPRDQKRATSLIYSTHNRARIFANTATLTTNRLKQYEGSRSAHGYDMYSQHASTENLADWAGEEQKASKESFNKLTGEAYVKKVTILGFKNARGFMHREGRADFYGV